MPDRYANGDPSNDTGGLKGPSGVTGFDPADPGYYHGGDLKGLDGRLQRSTDLGFTALWVTPVLKAAAGYGAPGSWSAEPESTGAGERKFKVSKVAALSK